MKALQDHVFTFDVFTRKKVYFQADVNPIQKATSCKKRQGPEITSSRVTKKTYIAKFL